MLHSTELQLQITFGVRIEDEYLIRRTGNLFVRVCLSVAERTKQLGNIPIYVSRDCVLSVVQLVHLHRTQNCRAAVLGSSFIIMSSYRFCLLSIFTLDNYGINNFVFLFEKQVVLQECEVLRRVSPTSSAIKRQSDGRPKDVHSRIVDIESRCGPGIEGYARPKKHCP